MSQNNKENILLDYAFISLISPKIKVIIVGGGRGGYIKAKSFLQRGCKLYVLSKEFDEKFEEIQEEYSEKLIFINDRYKSNYIKDKHIVIISTDNEELNNQIKNDCESFSKIYLTSSDFKDGIFVTPTQRETKNVSFAIHTKVGSPKTSVFLAQKIKENLSEYDEFVSYIGEIREKIKQEVIERKLEKKLILEIMNFINSDDFYFFYKLDKHELILKLFWREIF